MSILETDLGKAMTVEEVAEFLNLDAKTVRQYYQELGGVRFGRLYRFFEKEVVNAIQAKKQMDSSSEKGRKAKGKSFFDKKGSPEMGIRNEEKTGGRVEREDRHGLFI